MTIAKGDDRLAPSKTAPAQHAGSLLDESDLKRWAELLAQLTGWTFGRSRAHVLGRAVSDRQAALAIASSQAYFQYVTSGQDPTELARLIELVVNRETSFFRNEALLRAVGDRVVPDVLQRRSTLGTPVQVLSAGCATGQEAYSLAFVFAERCLPSAVDYKVHGIDISQVALATARAGRYTPDDVAAIPKIHRWRLQAQVAGTTIRYEIVPEVREHVTFAWVNLFSPGTSLPSCDLIVCQNVLIYFGARAASQIVRHLCSRLEPGGYLLLGPGDIDQAGLEGVDVVAFPQALCLRRRA